MPPASPRRLLPTLAISLAVHGLVGWVLDAVPRPARRAFPREESRRTAGLTWVDVPAPVASQPQQPEPPPSRGARALDARPLHVTSSRKAAALPADGARHDTSEVSARDQAARASDTPMADAPRHLASDTPRLGAMDVPRADVPLARDAPGSAGSISSSEPPAPRLLLAARTQGAPIHRGTVETPPPPEQGLSTTSAPPTPQALVEDLVAESVGRGKVDRGLVHPYFTQLGKALVSLWDADRSVKEHGLQGYFDMGLERSRAYARVWSERAAQYGASGAFAAKHQPEEDRRRPLSTVGDSSLRMRRELREKMREEFRSTRRALIRVIQDRHGRLLDVVLVEPSHQLEVDQEALKDVRAAAQKLPPPPPDAVGSRQRIVSLWEFELILSISPPIPVFTFEFDEALGFIDTRLPLDKRIYKRVRLIEVR
ncbi:energy transducer TonB family protein [Myxococcus landrumensis]|uniref:TonB C-terminal domain-containing protein n=1 Tax=Myxococcus landrumensis TaxID=2813577 RepID=A0ABX7N8G2_9BACT|nr:energy transducer TonB [Myxococcus landrumus]QSQ13711.1 TonB C-terminal domain-containing protein [Myxococcus landrumus]